MKQKDKCGIESIVASENKPARTEQSTISKKLPYYAISTVSSVGAGFSFCMTGISAYAAVKEYLKLTPEIIAAAPIDDATPYQNVIGYSIAGFFALLATGIFIWAAVHAIKETKEQHCV